METISLIEKRGIDPQKRACALLPQGIQGFFILQESCNNIAVFLQQLL